MSLQHIVTSSLLLLSLVVAGTASLPTRAAAATSGSLSAAVAGDASVPIRYGGSSEPLDLRSVRLVGADNANGLKVVVGVAGEKRRVTLTVPSLFTAGPALAMTGWRVQCQPAAGTTGHAATTEAGGQHIDRYTIIRNLVEAQAWTARARSMMTFSAPGEYLCTGLWGARSQESGYQDSSASVRVDPANPAGGSLQISAPLTGGSGLDQQCFLSSKLYNAGLKPDSCYLTLSTVATGTARRLTTSTAARTVDVVAVTAPTDGRTILAQATIKVTTCSGSGEGAGNEGCLDSDVVANGHSIFNGGLKFVVPGTNEPLPTSCLTTVSGTATMQLDLPRNVHHSIVQWDYRFTVTAQPGCQDFKIASTIAVSAGSAGIFDQLDSQITVTSA